MNSRNKSTLSKLLKQPYGWLTPIIFFVAWYALLEFGLPLVKADIAAMLWIPFHFVITPIMGFAISIATVYITITRKRLPPITASTCCSLGIIWVSYIGMSGSTMILDTFGVSFK